MFDIGWTEMALVAMVAILVIGPKELPRVLRNIGRAMGKARSMAREFRNSIDEMAEEAVPRASGGSPLELPAHRRAINRRAGSAPVAAWDFRLRP